MSASPSKYPFYKDIPEAEKDRVFAKFKTGRKTLDQICKETGLAYNHLRLILNEKLNVNYGRKLEK